MPEYEYKFLFALVDTVVIETVVLILFVKRIYKKEMEDVSWERVIFSGIICSFATLPYLWFIAPIFLPTKALLYSIGEIGVFLLESVILYFLLRIKFTRAIVISLCCNLASFLLGIFII
ncbi:MAG TPA: hypothetical protein ENG70_01365 [Candidatus Cloacimonetes bacterium]|nr:hypothetical protein [Candidatus Cloacimonadota bacterium]HEX37498.1 hypothetical protein [Candidatus Cloacimonadota bacterium]